ncbi:MAG: hypothetical protein SNJ29_11495 [Rikenellaceae bacterium]
MEKIFLSKEEKRLLAPILSKGFGANFSDEDNQWLYLLEEKGFIHTNKCEGGSVYTASRTDYAVAYVAFNPDLSNPSIWDDKKYLVTTAISLFAVVISILALYISIVSD